MTNDPKDSEEDALKADQKRIDGPHEIASKNKKPTKEALQDTEHRMDAHTDFGKIPANHADLDPKEYNNELRWNKIKEDYRHQYPSLSEMDLTFHAGKFETLKAKIAERTHRSAQEVTNEIINWQLKKDQ